MLLIKGYKFVGMESAIISGSNALALSNRYLY